MNITSSFITVSKKVKAELDIELKDCLSEVEHDLFVKYVRPYTEFSKEQLDSDLLIAEITFSGEGKVNKLIPTCSVDQENWFLFEDEPEMCIEPVHIPLKVVFPQGPIEVSGSKKIHIVMQSESNIWDQCKDLPDFVWDENKFMFMLSFSAEMEGGEVVYCNGSNELITF